VNLPALTLDRLVARAVRNLGPVNIEPSPRTNIVFGDNGQGKTSLLEAIYLVATSRSFRTAKLRDVVQHGERGFRVAATWSERRGELPSLDREQVVAYEGRASQVRIDGNPASTLASYATKSPVVVFHAEELALTTGAASIRRRLLDRVALYVAPASARAAGAYARALKTRQELLRRGSSDVELEAYEDVAARAGAELTRGRARAAAELELDVSRAFEDIGVSNATLGVRYERGGSEDADEAKHELWDRRSRDTRAPSATFGPHRDDLVITLEGHVARTVASQGQHRALTLAIKAAESSTIARCTGLEPVQLLDDVSSELDPKRTAALFFHLSKRRAQVFVTTTRPDVVAAALGEENTKHFQVVGGIVTVA